MDPIDMSGLLHVASKVFDNLPPWAQVMGFLLSLALVASCCIGMVREFLQKRSGQSRGDYLPQRDQQHKTQADDAGNAGKNGEDDQRHHEDLQT
jgi:hypothetical protein